MLCVINELPSNVIEYNIYILFLYVVAPKLPGAINSFNYIKFAIKIITLERPLF